MQVPAEWVGRPSARYDFNPKKADTGPAVAAYPRGTYSATELWSDPYLFLGATHESAEEIKLASLDEAQIVPAIRAWTLRRANWEGQDCKLRVARPFDDHGYRGFEERWDTCGEDGTGRIWQVIGYQQADRSVLFVYQYLMPFTDQDLAAAGEASLKTFQIKPDLVD
jgi:hypothetical protein